MDVEQIRVDPDPYEPYRLSQGFRAIRFGQRADIRKIGEPLGVRLRISRQTREKWQARASTIKAAHDAAAADLGEKAVNQKVCRALWDKVIPGMLDQFDCPSMLRLFAGRPLLILNGELDANCPIGGAKVAFAEAEKAFAAAKIEGLSYP